MNFLRITILTNGPGELWGWVRPVATELRKRGHSVSLWILPCQFASGHERRAASLLAVDKLEGPAGASKIWRDLTLEKTDAVIQLGGDIMFGQRLAKSANVSLTWYSYAPKNIKFSGVRILTAYQKQAGNLGKVQAIGDLVKDALQMDLNESEIKKWDWPKDDNSPRLLILPGSRPMIRSAVLEWVCEVHKFLRARIPNIRVRALFSRFMPESELEIWQKAGLNPVISNAGVAMRQADYALTQPGTNTFEMMHCGLPGLVIAPEKFSRFVPLSGVLGILANLPILGRKLRKIGALRVIKRWNGVISLPNRISDKKILNEMYGDITPLDVANSICEDITNPEKLKFTHDELLKLSGQSGAASRLCDIVLSGGQS